MKTPEQKTYVANAVAKHPSKRTAEEKAAILESMEQWEAQVGPAISGHTPGEWTIKNPDGNDVLIYGNGNIVPHDGRTSPVAVCYGVDRKANAQFIVTACNSHYELLEACNWMMSELCEAWDESPEKAIPAKYRAAIQSAQGKE